MVQKNFELVWENKSSSETVNLQDVVGAENKDFLRQILRKIPDIKGETFVIKLSADIIDDDEKLKSFASDIAILKGLEANIIIVHDHGEIVANTLEFFGIKEKFIHGAKVADRRASQIFEMVLSGFVNKKIVAALTEAGVLAIGLSGKDGGMIEAKKYQLSEQRSASKSKIFDLGFIGEPVIINPEALLTLEDTGMVTVFSPVACGPQGSTYLLDVDLTAAILASTLSASNLILLSPLGGIKIDDKVIAEMSHIEAMKIPRNLKYLRPYYAMIDAAISAIQNHAETALIIDSKIKNSLLMSICSDDVLGTRILSSLMD